MSNPDPNVAPIKNQKYGFRIIISGFGVIGGLAIGYTVAQFFAPTVTFETTLIAAALGYIGGFLSGRKQ